MGFESGALSFHAFYLSKAFDPTEIALLEPYKLPPLNTLTGEAPIHGWTGPSHAMDTDLSEGHCWLSDWLWFSHVTAQKKIPPSLLRAMVLAELDVERRARNVEVLPRVAKTEVRERVTEALLRDAQPSFTSMECAIDLRRQRLFATAMNDASMQLLCPYFRESTGCMPVLMCPESAAYRLCAVDANSVELLNLTPNTAIGVPPEITLGTEFLTWLFFRWEKEEATFKMDGETCGLMFEGPLVFTGDKAPGCHETVLRNGTPLDTPEFGIALWNGKKLRRAKLTLTKNDWVCTATVDGYDFSFRSMKVDPPKQTAVADAVTELPSNQKYGIPNEAPPEKPQKLTTDERLDRAAFYVDAFLHLYKIFLELRADPVAWRNMLSKMQPWIAHRAGQENA